MIADSLPYFNGIAKKEGIRRQGLGRAGSLKAGAGEEQAATASGGRGMYGNSSKHGCSYVLEIEILLKGTAYSLCRVLAKGLGLV